MDASTTSTQNQSLMDTGKCSSLPSSLGQLSMTMQMSHANSYDLGSSQRGENQQTDSVRINLKDTNTAEKVVNRPRLNKLGGSFRNGPTLKKRPSLLQRRQHKNVQSPGANKEGETEGQEVKWSQTKTSQMSLQLSLPNSVGSNSQKHRKPDQRPQEKLSIGFYDIVPLVSTTPLSASEKLVQQNQQSQDDIINMEMRLNAFLDEENVHNVMIQDYLKDLGVFTETESFMLRASSFEGMTPSPLCAVKNYPRVGGKFKRSAPGQTRPLTLVKKSFSDTTKSSKLRLPPNLGQTRSGAHKSILLQASVNTIEEEGQDCQVTPPIIVGGKDEFFIRTVLPSDDNSNAVHQINNYEDEVTKKGAAAMTQANATSSLAANNGPQAVCSTKVCQLNPNNQIKAHVADKKALGNVNFSSMIYCDSEEVIDDADEELAAADISDTSSLIDCIDNGSESDEQVYKQATIVQIPTAFNQNPENDQESHVALDLSR